MDGHDGNRRVDGLVHLGHATGGLKAANTQALGLCCGFIDPSKQLNRTGADRADAAAKFAVRGRNPRVSTG